MAGKKKEVYKPKPMTENKLIMIIRLNHSDHPLS